MPLDHSLLKNLKQRGDKFIAQCPACAESGADKRGDHLVILNAGTGPYGCIAFQGDAEHKRRIWELAGLRDAVPVAAPVASSPAKAKPEAPLDWWRDCERLAKDRAALERLAAWRGWTPGFAQTMAGAAVIGLHEGRVCFPVVKADTGAVIGRHCFQWPEVTGGPKAWYSPGKNAPLIIGAESLAGVAEVHLMESQWDALAMLHAKGWTGTALEKPFVVTRGTSISPELAKMLAGVQTVTLWPQRDAVKVAGKLPPSEEWTKRALALLPATVATVRRVDPPEGVKDWGDVIRAHGPAATLDAIKTAIRGAVALPISSAGPSCQNLRNLRNEEEETISADNADFGSGSDAGSDAASCEALNAPDEDDAPEPFPLAALPDVMRAMVTEAARVTLAPDTLTACCALAAVSAAIGGGLDVNSGGDRRTRGNLFVLAVAASGTGKGRAFDLVMKPFISAERTAVLQYNDEHLPRARAEVTAAEVRMKRLRDTLAKNGTTDAIVDELAQAERDLEAAKLRTVEPTWTTASVTGAKLQQLLSESPSETLASLSPEAREVVDVLAGKFSDGKGDESIYLSAYSGETCKVHRKSSLPVILSRPCLAVLWMIQPDKLREMLGNAALTDSGMMPRFLLCDTKAEPVDEPEHWPVMDEATTAGWSAAIRELARTFRARGKEPLTIETASGVQALLRDYHNELAAKRRTGGELADVSSYAARWSENAWRVAVVLHAAEHGASAPYEKLTTTTAEKALAIVRWFSAQQLQVLAAGRHERRASRLESLKAALSLYPEQRATLRDLERRNGIQKDEAASLARAFPAVLVLETVKPAGRGRPSETVRLLGK